MNEPCESGCYTGDIFFGDPEDSTKATHRWDGQRWHPFQPTTPMSYLTQNEINDFCDRSTRPNIASEAIRPIPSSLHRAQSALDVLHKDISELENRLQPVAPSQEVCNPPGGEALKEAGPTCEVDAKLHDIVNGITQVRRRVTDMLGRLKL